MVKARDGVGRPADASPCSGLLGAGQPKVEVRV
jgi:hypothetical protein